MSPYFLLFLFYTLFFCQLILLFLNAGALQGSFLNALIFYHYRQFLVSLTHYSNLYQHTYLRVMQYSKHFESISLLNFHNRKIK